MILLLGKTHRLGGVNAALGGFVALSATGNTLDDVNPLLQLAVVYPFAIYGSAWSDLDHHWGSVPFRDPVSRVFHTGLHATTKIRKGMKSSKMDKGPVYTLLGIADSSHRSWQTHSDLTFFGLIAILWWTCFSQWSVFSGPDAIIVKLILTGLILGTLAHIFLDAITPEGIWMVIPMAFAKITKNKKIPQKFGLVPDKHFFATGEKWENAWNKILTITSYLLLLWIIYDALPWHFEFNF